MRFSTETSPPLAWLPGVLAAALVALLALTGVGQRIEFATYDAASRLSAPPRIEAPEIALVAIDARSIDTLGRWPWSEEQSARLVELLAGANVSAIALLADFSAATQDQRVARIEELLGFYRGSSLPAAAVEDLDTLLALTRQLATEVDLGIIPYGESGSALALTEFVSGTSVLASRLPREMAELGSRLEQLALALDLDSQFAEVLRRAGNVVLPVAVRTSGDTAGVRTALPGYMIASSVVPGEDEGSAQLLDALLPTADRARGPLPSLGRAAAAVGHLHLPTDADGVLRRHPMFVSYRQQYLPSIALALAATHRGARIQEVMVDPSHGAMHRDQPLFPAVGLHVQPRWSGGRAAVAEFSAADVLTGRTPATELAGMAVVVGVTDPAVATRMAAPGGALRSEAEHVAAAAAALVGGDAIDAPRWSTVVGGAAFLLVLAWLTLAMPRLRAGPAIAATGVLVLVLLLVQFAMLQGSHAVWLKLGQPALLGALGLMLYLMMRPRPDADGTRVAAGEPGLPIPMPEEAGDEGAGDVPDRMRAERAGATPGQPELPEQVGGYRVRRYVGDGTLGPIYLAGSPSGPDEVVLRTVDPAALRDAGLRERVRERLFRDAEAAAALRHPNIASVIDFGEQDAHLYLVEERAPGQPLALFTSVERLLDGDTAMAIVTRLAEALDYAHDRGVVHRDLRASAILFDPGAGTVKLTGFAAAGAVDEGLARTGRIPDAPVYLAPEQVSGEAGDARTDLYALGVLMFELLGGMPPYEAGSLTQLMYRIANERPRDLFELRPDLRRQGACVQEIVNHALARDPQDRYQRGMDLAADLRRCARWLAGDRP